MIKQQKLEDLIREKVYLGVLDKRGFYSHKCQVCNDYKVRAGFKFENGSIGFNCWNCSTTAMYEEFSGEISSKMRKVLRAYSINDDEITQVVKSAFFFKKEEPEKLTLASLKQVNTATAAIKLPPNSHKLGENIEHLDAQEKLVEYLDNRKVDLEKWPFYFSTNDRFKDRIIIPFYRNGSLIFWQARSIDPLEKKRYDNSVVPRDAVMFNMDELQKFSPFPLFISEGVFDAMMFNGVALLGSKLTDAKLTLLRKSKRRLVFVFDKDKGGRGLANRVISEGWEITFTEDANDLNHSVQRFGRAWTMQRLMTNICSGDKGRLMINSTLVG